AGALRAGGPAPGGQRARARDSGHARRRTGQDGDAIRATAEGTSNAGENERCRAQARGLTETSALFVFRGGRFRGRRRRGLCGLGCGSGLRRQGFYGGVGELLARAAGGGRGRALWSLGSFRWSRLGVERGFWL